MEVQSQFIEMFKNLPVNGVIKDLTVGNIASVKKSYSKEDIINYIDISSIDNTTKTIVETSEHLVTKAPSRAQQCVQKGDILVSTVRPINRNIAVIEEDTSHLVASTGFCILRPQEGYKEYLLSIVLSDTYTEKMCDKANGGLYPAVNNSDVLNYGIHIPDEDTAKKVSALYQQSDKSKFVGFKSQFIEMVGDPRSNPKGWKIKKLPDIASYSIGLTYKPEQLCEDGTIVLRSGNIQEGEIDLQDLVRVNAPIRDNLWVKEGDILMCSRNGSASLVGKVAQIKSIVEPMTYGAFMTIIRSEYSDYLYMYFQSGDFRDQISSGKSSTMNQITQKMLDKIEIPIPNQEVISTLSAILHQSDKSKLLHRKSIKYSKYSL